MNFYVGDNQRKKPSHLNLNLARTIFATRLHENPHASLHHGRSN